MEWYPTPSYLLKRKVILDFLAGTGTRTFLEVGCGAGDLLVSLARQGYRGLGIDIAEDAVAAARSRLSGNLVAVRVMDVSEVADRFDVVIASEVLEHCEDDSGFLQQLKERIVPGGWLLLTVPAHMNKWGANDDFCGHLRRYERAEIQEKIGRAGFELQQVCSYGVPLYNLMKPLYDCAIARRMQHGEEVAERTRKSGGMWLFKRLGLLFRLLFNDITLQPFYAMQRLFFASELGNGYFVAARTRIDEVPGASSINFTTTDSIRP